MTAVAGKPKAAAPAAGTRREVVQRDQHASIVKSLTRVLGRVGSFVKENWRNSAAEVEERMESLCKVFEEMKPYLIEHWGYGEEEVKVMGDIWKTVIIDSFNKFLGKIITFFPNLLAMVTILILGFIIAWLVKKINLHFLRAIQFDKVSERWGLTLLLAQGGVTYSPANLLSRFFYWIIVLITLIRGINALEVAATQNFIAQFFNYLPNLFAAILILVVGYLIAIFIQATLIAAVNAQMDSARPLSRTVRWFVFKLELLDLLELEILDLFLELELLYFLELEELLILLILTFLFQKSTTVSCQIIYSVSIKVVLVNISISLLKLLLDFLELELLDFFELEELDRFGFIELLELPPSTTLRKNVYSLSFSNEKGGVSVKTISILFLFSHFL